MAQMDKRVGGDGEIEQQGLQMFGLWREPVVATLNPQNPVGDAYKRGGWSQLRHTTGVPTSF